MLDETDIRYKENFLPTEYYHEIESFLNHKVDANSFQGSSDYMDFWSMIIFDKSHIADDNLAIGHFFRNVFIGDRTSKYNHIVEPIYDYMSEEFNCTVDKILRTVLVATINSPTRARPSGHHTDIIGTNTKYDRGEFLTALLYLDDSNGGTDFECGKFVKSKRNALALFPGQMKHRPVYASDVQVRFLLLFNFDGKFL